uniref:Equilibrative nucleoside transporter 1-like n=1 Tax=Rhabditophanes sp. KR3021 TaxID=114890 RepID=A0AC35TH48_9BILA
MAPPKDHWKVCYFIVLLHGIGFLMPYNLLVTIAGSYYVGDKLSDHNSTGDIVFKSTYALNFYNYFNIFSEVPMVIVMFINLIVRLKGDLLNRISIMILIIAGCILFTMVWIFIDTNSWKSGFFWMTMGSFIIFNGAGGVYQNSMFGVAAILPSSFTNALVFGNSICGTFIAIINIITIAASNNVNVSTTAYFIITLAVILICFFSIPVLKKLPFYKYYEDLAKNADGKDSEKLNAAALLFIPFFCFCNFRPNRRTWNVWFENELWYIIGTLVLAITSGYFSSLIMMYAPKRVDVSKSHIAGMLSALFLMSGIACGGAFTFLITSFIEDWGPLQSGSKVFNGTACISFFCTWNYVETVDIIETKQDAKVGTAIGSRFHLLGKAAEK